jgi:hypothetical protein
MSGFIGIKVSRFLRIKVSGISSKSKVSSNSNQGLRLSKYLGFEVSGY